MKLFNRTINLKKNKLSKFLFSQLLTPEKYLKEVEYTLNSLNDQLESLELEIVDNLTLVDGVLNIQFNNNKNYVLNIQRPNQQIWLSSPISGPQRFEYDIETKTWRNIRNKQELLKLLNDEINNLLVENKIDKKVQFEH